MRKFKVTTSHTIYVDSYEQGEKNQVNYYTMESIQKTETVREAIENHFNNTVYLPFNFDKADTNEEKDAIFWSNLVDENNAEPSQYDIEEWKKGEKELYSNNTTIFIDEIISLKFD